MAMIQQCSASFPARGCLLLCGNRGQPSNQLLPVCSQQGGPADSAVARLPLHSAACLLTALHVAECCFGGFNSAGPEMKPHGEPSHRDKISLNATQYQAAMTAGFLVASCNAVQEQNDLKHVKPAAVADLLTRMSHAVPEQRLTPSQVLGHYCYMADDSISKLALLDAVGRYFTDHPNSVFAVKLNAVPTEDMLVSAHQRAVPWFTVYPWLQA